VAANGRVVAVAGRNITTWWWVESYASAAPPPAAGPLALVGFHPFGPQSQVSPRLTGLTVAAIVLADAADPAGRRAADVATGFSVDVVAGPAAGAVVVVSEVTGVWAGLTVGSAVVVVVDVEVGAVVAGLVVVGAGAVSGVTEGSLLLTPPNMSRCPAPS